MPPARRQLRELARWWRENRPAAADQVLGELARITSLLERHPYIGSPYEALLLSSSRAA